MKPITSFRIHPQASGKLYFVVNIWPTKKAMHAHCWWVNANFDACCSGYDRIKNGRKANHMGEINFAVKFLGAGVVTHEMVHAAMRHAGRHQYRGLSFDQRDGMVSQAEEYLADVISRLTTQFWCHYYRKVEVK